MNRGAAYLDGRISLRTLDGNAIAVDAATGKDIWKTNKCDLNGGATISMAPLVVKHHVLVGDSGGEMGTRGKFSGLDAKPVNRLASLHVTPRQRSPDRSEFQAASSI